MQGLGQGARYGLTRGSSMTSTRRAASLRTLPGVVLLGLLAACSGGSTPPAPPFHSTEVSGIDYGRGLRIADSEGVPRALEDFRGQVLVVFFGFASCPDVCPTTLARLKMVRQAMGAEAEPAHGRAGVRRPGAGRRARSSAPMRAASIPPSSRCVPNRRSSRPW